MPQASVPNLGEIAYAAYGQSTGNRNFLGDPMPDWSELPDPIQTAWQAAAQAIVDELQDTGSAVTALQTLEPAPQLPSLGRIVLIPMDPALNNGALEAPAVITRVWNDSVINVRVLSDSDRADAEWRTSLQYVDSVDTLDRDDPARLYRWSWPPRI